jgi:hypothetical protein
MRPKVVIAAVSTCALLLLLALGLNWFRPAPAGTPETPATGEAVASETAPGSPEPTMAAPATGQFSPALTNETVDPVERRIAELYAMGMRNDVEARESVLVALENPERAIREAALDAAIQSGDRSIVPRLQEMADRTEDPQEKAAILEAINFINLPSLNEYLAERRTNASLRTNIPRASDGRLRTPPREQRSRQ